MSAELLRRAAAELRRAASHGRVVTIDAAAAVALADWIEALDDIWDGKINDEWPDVPAALTAARAILRPGEPS
jgi:hypothetical protein